ncbi:MAG: DNA repair ATPase [Thermoanaerobaculia bacterium]|nr:DNA repair ATPase [Thermoanaerobaculia bacterium]
MTDTTPDVASDSGTDAASGPGKTASYDLLLGRLRTQSEALATKAEALNARRLELFGGTESEILGTERIRTENNCVPRDIVAVGNRLLFGYNVFLGLKRNTEISDVFSVHTLDDGNGGVELSEIPASKAQDLLGHPDFVRDFEELFKYYKEARLLQVRRVGSKLLAVFQTGKAIHDIKVFRWSIAADGSATYVDNRGERDHVFPPTHDFEWIRSTRDDFVLGRHPHVSILDEVFVEAVGGDLTVKVENNTEDGRGIYCEPVEDSDQGLDDGEVRYAKLGGLILIEILPYGESHRRYLVFDTRTQRVRRIDAVGQACQQLPEDHGIVFPGGYYLQTGVTKTFEGDVSNMEFTRSIRSPNGEDVLYVFHRRDEGSYLLLPYNLIRRQVDNPISCNGYSLFGDGRLVIFRSVSEEPTRVHPVQVWQTPFHSAEHAAALPSTGSYLEGVGNADLVRGISEAFGVRRVLTEGDPTRITFEDLLAQTTRMLDSFPWLGHAEAGDLRSSVAAVHDTTGLVLDEFEKVVALREEASRAVEKAGLALKDLERHLQPEAWNSIDPFVDALAGLRRQRGHLISLRDMRYVDLKRIDQLEERVVSLFDALSGRAVVFLLEPAALEPYRERIEALAVEVGAVEKNTEVAAILTQIEETGEALDLLTEVVGGLEIEDATQRTDILEAISETLSGLNRARALATVRRKELFRHEGVAEFAAQFKVFGQTVSSALALADTPDKCDEQLARSMVQLEDLESRFSELDEFLEQLAVKREEVYQAFESRKQQLRDERGRQAEHVNRAADRILESMARRAATLPSLDELNAYFASDAMAVKVHDLVARLRHLEDHVRADELEARLKAAREEASRSLRDRLDLFEEGAAVLKLGRHRFAVNTQAVEPSLLMRDEQMVFHLTGTDYYVPLPEGVLADDEALWSQALVSESREVYRGEYLAGEVLEAARAGRQGLTLEGLRGASLELDGLLDAVRRFALERYDEGYERGVHDSDAALILERVLALEETAGLLAFSARSRAAALLFWAHEADTGRRRAWIRRAESLARLRGTFSQSSAIEELSRELSRGIAAFHEQVEIALDPAVAGRAGTYLFEELAVGAKKFVASGAATSLRDAFLTDLDRQGVERDFREDLRSLQEDLGARFQLVDAWVRGFAGRDSAAGEGTAGEGKAAASETLSEAASEVIALLLTEGRQEVEISNALDVLPIEGLLGQHPRLEQGRMLLRLADFHDRLDLFRRNRVPAFRKFSQRRRHYLEEERDRLRLDELKPRVMTSLVRNRLIDEVYLPLIGNNLAKQIGALGDGKVSDRSGLLLLVSPPGYGKTTLMEYLASRLGLVFVKVNGPALGHAVTSLDPAEAPNATARQEVERINFAFEMGNNVLLYLDDIQHTHPELLQKFISLCDAQRRVEGVWRGRTRTYDLRGKRFAVCMAGNPYTESGARFQVPDMLANRADIYNLGDVLEGKEELFALSYLENSLTANPALAPLASRGPEDVLSLLQMAQGRDVSPDQLKHSYSTMEFEEILSVLRKLLVVQKLLLQVNQQYIASAGQDNDYRTEPAFLLQGSYRNMVKVASQIVPAMNDEELQSVISDHYVGEAQTLTTGAEANLLKLAEIRDRLSEREATRWEAIRDEYRRRQMMGGADDDPATRIVGGLSALSERLSAIGKAVGLAADRTASHASEAHSADARQAELAASISQLLEARSEREASAPPAVPEEVLTQLPRLAAAVEGIAAAMAATAASAGGPSQGAGDQAITPYLDKLESVLGQLAQSTASASGGRVIQTLSPGVHDLMSKLVDSISKGLIPGVRGVERELEKQGVEPGKRLGDLLDRSLKDLDLLRDLVEALKKIDTGRLA